MTTILHILGRAIVIFADIGMAWIAVCIASLLIAVLSHFLNRINKLGDR